jgi:hypothetical protein
MDKAIGFIRIIRIIDGIDVYRVINKSQCINLNWFII